MAHDLATMRKMLDDLPKTWVGGGRWELTIQEVLVNMLSHLEESATAATVQAPETTHYVQVCSCGTAASCPIHDPQPLTTLTTSPAGWTCACLYVNRPTAVMCDSCRRLRPGTTLRTPDPQPQAQDASSPCSHQDWWELKSQWKWCQECGAIYDSLSWHQPTKPRA